MKDPSSSMEVCPFCAKAFKRLKSHLPHCKMAETKSETLEPDSRDKCTTANLASVQRKGTTLSNVEKREVKVKGKSKTEGLKRQVLQDKTKSLSQATQVKVVSGNGVFQEKSATANEDSKKAFQTTIKITSIKEQVQDQVPLAEPSASIQKALVLRPSLEKIVPAKVDSQRAGMSSLTVRVCSENLEDRDRLCVPEQISEQDIERNSVRFIGVQDHFQGQFHEQVHLDQSSMQRVPSGSTKASMDIGWPNRFPQERIKAQVSGIFPSVSNIEAEMCNNKALGTVRESTEMNMDFKHPPKTIQVRPQQLVDDPVGLQWVPQLYSNYVQCRVVPGRQDQWDPHRTGPMTLQPIGGLPELFKTEPRLENQSISKPLMDIRLGELPAWLANRRYSPKIIPQFIKNAWGRYYNKYINVRKGGVSGLTMLLAGYCVLSYSWNYNHIKQDRWRKYH